MDFHNPAADLFVPDGLEMPAALSRTTHLAIAAHQDDLEIMAYHGIANPRAPREPERQIADLLAFCGVPFDAACLDYTGTARSVRTASASQVREPLMRNTARADKFGALLDPLRKALGMAPFAQ